MQRVIPALVAATLLTAGAAAAAECPGNPDAIGTSRTIVVDPVEHPHLGSMQYRESLPLEDHEVVLTFDDGPLPPRSTHVLDILASECVKATFFLVGKMATTYPDVVHKIEAAGHTIGTHSQTHPLRLHKVPLAKAEEEINGGIASVTSVLGHPPSPFFRIPGLARTNAIDQYTASQKLMTWSADFPADDWTKITPAQVYSRALQRIEANGKGILLLHDIQPRTVEALPALLHELKRRGYRIVHVVPATPDLPKTATLASQWVVHVHAREIWPASFVEAEDNTVLPFPSPASFGAVHPFDALAAVAVNQHGRVVFRPGQSTQLPASAWPRAFSELQAPLAVARSVLPAPSRQTFSYPETAPTPWLPRKLSSLGPMPATSRVVPPEPDALAMLIRRSLQETQAPDEPATTQSVPAATPRSAANPLSTTNMPHGAFP
jgi:peptidoglycan/xylan/chitin deacetylase (PgdA/CDA1 family)